MPARRVTRTRVASLATAAQTGSAAVLGTFLVSHVLAPFSAALVPHAAADVASRAMLFGRVYYQNAVLEPLLVWGALGVHVVAGLVRRAAARPKRRGSWDPRRWGYAQWHVLSGYVLLPTALVHLLANRVVPAHEGAPAHALSPAELDMEYVALGFRYFPYVSAALYAALIAAAAVHGPGGASVTSRWVCAYASYVQVWPYAAAATR
ncbi:hypothetical protein MSPP1_003973 [Malassezia sp. CBS 17886]|nr:hypothetical protein MSPP1_003973 [Malassezia sp. CBS 17886]